MFKKLTLALGFGAGYVLGAKAGTQRYEQIVSKAREIAGMPAVQNATAQVQDTASTLADRAKDTVNEKVEQVSGSGGTSGTGTTGTGTGGTGTGDTAVVGLATGTGTGATTRSTAAAGAAPSATAPITRP